MTFFASLRLTALAAVVGLGMNVLGRAREEGAALTRAKHAKAAAKISDL